MLIPLEELYSKLLLKDQRNYKLCSFCKVEHKKTYITTALTFHQPIREIIVEIILLDKFFANRPQSDK